MTGQVPAYLVRNLVQVALSRTDSKPTKKTRSTKTLCLAIPTKSSKRQDRSLNEVKELLKLHKRFEIEAERALYNGVAKTDEESLNLRPAAVRSAPCEGKTKDLYLREIHEKLSLPPSPELPALSGRKNTPKQLEYCVKKRLNSSRNIHQMGENFSLPALTDTPFNSGESSHSNELYLRDDSKIKDLERFENFDLLQESLTVVPLSKENFASYDSLLSGVRRRRKASPGNEIENAQHTETPFRVVIPVSETRSEDGLFVNFDEYLRELSDRESEASFDQGESGNRLLDNENKDSEPSLALVEYKPMYRRNVHFSKDLHEVHLYSPVQNHRRRRRKRRDEDS